MHCPGHQGALLPPLPPLLLPLLLLLLPPLW
jgi:hypothetical protein